MLNEADVEIPTVIPGIVRARGGPPPGDGIMPANVQQPRPVRALREAAD
jgi:hypothetical protein